MICGRTKVLPEKWLESCLTNQLFFLSKLRWPLKKKIYTHIEPLFLSKMWWPPKKKRSTLKLNRYFCPNCGDFQRPHLETVFSSSVRKILRGKLAQTTWNYPKFWRIIAQKIWNCPKFWRKIVIWNCPKFCPKFGHLTPTEGASVPPPPPTPMDKFMTKTCQNSKVMMQYSAQKPRKMIGIRFALYVFFLLVFLINQHSLCLLR